MALEIVLIESQEGLFLMSEVPLYTGLYPVIHGSMSPDLGTPRLRWGVVYGIGRMEWSPPQQAVVGS